MSYQSDLYTVRELARKYAEIAHSPRHVRMRQRFCDTNDLKTVRPPLNMDEIPWFEMNFDHELDCICEDAELKGIEYFFRVMLYREKYFKCDNMIEPVWPVYKAWSSTGCGFQQKFNIAVTDEKNNIVSRQIEDMIPDENALSAYHDPVVTAYPDKDAENVAHMNEIFDGILPVVLRGATIYHAPWDRLTYMRGVEPILTDFYDRPDFLHKIIGLMTQNAELEMNQMEALGLYDGSNMNLHCTPYSVTVPDPSENGCHLQDVWFRTMAQLFSSISPSMHEEFDMMYSAPLAKRCAFTYYGCCEPLQDRIDLLKKNYPNLRKVGVSPWANVQKSAEQLGSGFVLSRKPNPANVAKNTDPDVVRKEITETVEACIRYGCPLDITLKDISTVGYRPENLMVWAQTASDVLDKYYGEE